MAFCPTGSGYEPSSAVETFHGIPHTDIDLQDSPDDFDPSSTHYWEVRRCSEFLISEQFASYLRVAYTMSFVLCNHV